MLRERKECRNGHICEAVRVGRSRGEGIRGERGGKTGKGVRADMRRQERDACLMWADVSSHVLPEFGYGTDADLAIESHGELFQTEGGKQKQKQKSCCCIVITTTSFSALCSRISAAKSLEF